MSKSKGNTIDIFLPENNLRKQIMSIQTDRIPIEDPKDPESCNVFSLYSILASESETEILKEAHHKIIDFRSLLGTFWTPGPLLGGI